MRSDRLLAAAVGTLPHSAHGIERDPQESDTKNREQTRLLPLYEDPRAWHRFDERRGDIDLLRRSAQGDVVRYPLFLVPKLRWLWVPRRICVGLHQSI